MLKHFKNDREKINFLIPIIARYRIFIMKYLNITRLELIEQLSLRLSIPEKFCHLKNIKTLQQCDNIIKELKNWKQELTGSKRLPENVNPRDYAKKLRGELKMKVVEIFNSIDGEGKRTGELTTFIRLYGCNLRCSFCDTKYSYEQENSDLPYKEMSIEEIIKECDKYDTDNITLTGGEPLGHLDVKYLLRALSEAGYNVNVETNGSLPIKQYFDSDGNPAEGYKNVWFTVDYKCPSSEMESKMYLDNFDQKKNLFKNVVYKFVVGSDLDLQKAEAVIKERLFTDYDIGTLIYLSPIFGAIEPKEIVEYMQKHELFNAKSPIRCQVQLHKVLWDPDKRSV